MNVVIIDSSLNAASVSAAIQPTTRRSFASNIDNQLMGNLWIWSLQKWEKSELQRVQPKMQANRMSREWSGQTIRKGQFGNDENFPFNMDANRYDIKLSRYPSLTQLFSEPNAKWVSNFHDLVPLAAQMINAHFIPSVCWPRIYVDLYIHWLMT